MSRSLKLLVVTLFALFAAASPASAMSPAGPSDTVTPKLRAGICTGHTYRPDIVYPPYGGKYVAGTADQTCTSSRPFTQTVCVKIQGNYGSPTDGSWFNLTDWRCTDPNTGPSISGTNTISCSAAGVTTFRTAARGTVYPSNYPSQTRYGYSAGVKLC